MSLQKGVRGCRGASLAGELVFEQALRLDDPVERDQLLEKRLHVAQRHRVRAVRECLGRIGMGLHEDAGDADRDRGASFGYNNLVSDMRSLAIMRETGAPIVFDATHSVQLPGGQGTSSGGQREFVPVLARAAVAVGVAGLFMETHPHPANAMSDGPNAVPLKHMKALLEQLVELDRAVKSQPFLENDFAC